MSAFAALSLLCITSSCKDQNFDWDQAHATEQYQKFTNVFIEEFGKPAEGHQWGFDVARFCMGGDFSSSTSPSTRGYYKYETNWEALDKIVDSARPADITQKEHEEVYAWFSCHKVTWTYTPSYSKDPRTNQLSSVAVYTTGNKIALKNLNSFTDKEYAYDGSPEKLVNAENYMGSLATGGRNEINHCYSNREIDTNITFHNGWIQRVASNCLIETTYKTLLNMETYYLISDNFYVPYGSVYVQVDAYGNKMYKIGDDYYAEFTSTNYDKCAINWEKDEVVAAWDGYSKSMGTKWRKCSGNGTAWEGNFIDALGTSDNLLTIESIGNNDLNQYYVDKPAHMDYLCAADRNGIFLESNHLNDFNSEYAGFGYASGGQGNRNYAIAIDVDFNRFTYKSSDSGGDDYKCHDKYIVVYLKGEGYEGYYVGFDFEAWGTSIADKNQRIKADGYCNDWIIKIAEADVHREEYQNARIMCEDLGGNFGVSATDIDYNDLVLDVQYTNMYVADDASKVTLTLQAAGGTLPLAVFYNDEKLFEVHEYFNGKTNEFVDANLYKTMYNTRGTKSESGLSPSALTDKKTARSYVLYFVPGTVYESLQDWQKNQMDGFDANQLRKTQNYFSSGKFDLDNLKIKVWRNSGGVSDYLASSPNGTSTAEWIDIENEYGEAPLKLCTPIYDSNNNYVKWLQERVKIDEGYTSFREWVGNPMIKFWNLDKNPSSLY